MNASRGLLTKALHEALSAASNYPVGLVRAPTIGVANESVVPLPYSIIYPVSSTFWGSPLTDPESEIEADYQITVVAKTPLSAEWLADEIRTILVRRGADGDFAVSLSVPDLVIQDILILDSFGPTPEGQLFNTRETYRIKAGKQ